MKKWTLAMLIALPILARGQQEPKPAFEDPMGGADSTSSSNQKTKDSSSATAGTNATVPTEIHQNQSIVGVVPPNPMDPMSGSSPVQVTPPSSPKAKEKTKPPLTPDVANLNLPNDLTVEDPDPEKVMFLPAGTYRQILQFPIDSPLMQKTQLTRERHGPEIKVEELVQRPSPNATKPLWIRYEGLEKIKVGPDERRGGIDLPVNSHEELKPRLWYAKSEDADSWSSLFYFVFGGAGYTVANMAGWSVGNTREIPVKFEYRLIRK